MDIGIDTLIFGQIEQKLTPLDTHSVGPDKLLMKYWLSDRFCDQKERKMRIVRDLAAFGVWTWALLLSLSSPSPWSLMSIRIEPRVTEIWGLVAAGLVLSIIIIPRQIRTVWCHKSKWPALYNLDFLKSIDNPCIFLWICSCCSRPCEAGCPDRMSD